ncbi:MAG: thioredoxin-dependent peroxiredoxin [Patescibacteria group bacterium]|jgi:peroxiredoxin Q/BCP|nr:thioredoxin-dependent peroxiredoxin [Patescibacteria group bacterium]
MSHPLEQKTAPAFSLPDQQGKQHALADYKGKWVVLYFYPKDMTPGCTVEACSFRDNEARLKTAGAIVLGVSADSVKRHEKFAKNESLNFPLLADESKEVCKAYKSFGKKKFMGREYEGIMRNTFLIDPKGTVVKVYESVKPGTHVAEILEDLKAFA